MKHIYPGVCILLLTLLSIGGCEVNQQHVVSPVLIDTTSTVVHVSVSPTDIVVTAGQSQQFQSTVTGTGVTQCTWTVESGPGTINAEGLYTPPATISEDTVAVVIKAVLQSDTSILARANVKVVKPPLVDNCDTVNVGFAATIKPILQVNCTGCHSGQYSPLGIDLSTYASAKIVADDGRLYGTISHSPGFLPMPEGTHKLDDCTIRKIKSWIDRGAPND